ncbi:hypothetical protein CONPUDRAFT_76682 [Coniophora puteana RWD-64-598 SS2]|uniref:DUF6533 domain-containing protein n=1 Tax=Coniophora puteana (strain RWD-64-598) TaxID=741705 RepID=A0A5M3MAK4_CONPW|nr:uncharacterized protein CONPUDRAFT_76682 [Coniophora puteana RWD-64-598 SS2]EIW76312.1 hypothetical protein CONPUDRAFT_76682 [Coniophora puteana RWD-64-598 SS2]
MQLPFISASHTRPESNIKGAQKSSNFEWANFNNRWAQKQYSNVAAAAFLLQDYFLTLESEVSWTARKRWSLPRVIFTVARYVPFIGTGLTLASALNINIVTAFHFLGIIAAECLLIFRVYVCYDLSKRLLLLAIILGLLYNDGLFYMAAIIAITTTNIIIGLTLPVRSPLPLMSTF